MRLCVAEVTGADGLLLDFYDQDRMARWATQFPGVCAWVREQVGQPIEGWRGHGEWAAPRSGPMPYLADEHPRLWAVDTDEEAPLPITAGMRRMRDALACEGCVVRLVGLSGTGKTRLAQALFERDVEPDSALDRTIALYADLADDNSNRQVFLTQLQSMRLRAVVVLDNCTPEQHRRFADLCGAAGSRLSLLTLNLDVQDDQPEHTRVFRLDTASIDVTAGIVWRAVLPQALAVHLAREALAGLLPHVLEQSLQQAPSRLMNSFTRQLGLLHDNPEAQALVKKWLAPGGQPCDPSVFNGDETAWFMNLAPVDRPGALAALEQVTSRPSSQWQDLCMKLATIAAGPHGLATSPKMY